MSLGMFILRSVDFKQFYSKFIRCGGLIRKIIFSGFCLWCSLIYCHRRILAQRRARSLLPKNYRRRCWCRIALYMVWYTNSIGNQTSRKHYWFSFTSGQKCSPNHHLTFFLFHVHSTANRVSTYCSPFVFFLNSSRGQFCPDFSELVGKLLRMQKVARDKKVTRDTRSCQKAAEQLVESPIEC